MLGIPVNTSQNLRINDANRQRVFCAVNHPGKYISAIIVCPEPVLSAWFLKLFFDMLLHNVLLKVVEELGKNGNKDNDDNQNKGYHCAWVFLVVSPDLCSKAALFIFFLSGSCCFFILSCHVRLLTWNTVP